MYDEGNVKCNNDSRCNADHLATENSKVENKVTNATKWVACGFNGFGQLCMSKQKLSECKKFRALSEEHLSICASTWSYLACGSGCSLHLQGFICNAPYNMKEIRTLGTIKSVAACDRYCLILQEDGKVFKVLINGTAELEEIKFQTNIKLPKKRSYLLTNNKLKVEHLSCGNNIVVAIGNSNEVFSATSQIYQFEKHVRVKQVVCGLEHALLLTTNGEIYSWGNGLKGQLGQDVLSVEETPSMVKALAGLMVCFVACSGWHSAAITVFGDLYTWGYNSHGQLGLRIYKDDIMKEPTVLPLPQIIEIPDCMCKIDGKSDCLPVKVICGSRHTALLLSCGSILACGYNAYGQLGRSTSSTYCDNMQQVCMLEKNTGFVKLEGGYWCTLVGMSD